MRMRATNWRSSALAGARVLKEAEPHWRAAQTQVEKELKKYLKGPAKEVLLEALETLQHVGGER